MIFRGRTKTPVGASDEKTDRCRRGGGLAIVTSAAAEDYPSRPITIIVPFAAGGPTDALARMLGEGMRAALGQPIVVENVTGAGGTIGVARAVHAAPDGYTLSIGHLEHPRDQWRDLSLCLRFAHGS